MQDNKKTIVLSFPSVSNLLNNMKPYKKSDHPDDKTIKSFNASVGILSGTGLAFALNTLETSTNNDTKCFARLILIPLSIFSFTMILRKPKKFLPYTAIGVFLHLFLRKIKK